MSHEIKYIGMDVHKEAMVIAVLNGSGKLVMETILETKASSILQFLHGLRGERRKKHRKNVWLSSGGIARHGIGRRKCDSLVPRKKLDYQPLLLKAFLMQDPYCWSAIPVRTQRVMQLLPGTWQSHVSL